MGTKDGAGQGKKNRDYVIYIMDEARVAIRIITP